jgi:hypothetical protein
VTLTPSPALTAVVGAAVGIAGRPMTYKIFISSVFNPATGQTVVTYVDVVLNALVEPISVHEVGMSGSLVQVGDLRILISYAHLTPALVAAGKVLTTSDRVLIDGASKRVIGWEIAATGTLLRVLARV